MDQSIKDIIIEFASAHYDARDNASLLLQDQIKYQDLCVKRMSRISDIDIHIHSLSSNIEPKVLSDYLKSNNDKGCQVCWFSSSGPIHKECGLKIKRWFDTKDSLLNLDYQ